MKALAAPVEKTKPKKKRHAKKSSKDKNGTVEKEKEEPETNGIISISEARRTDAEDLGEFIDIHHQFSNLPNIMLTVTVP